MAKELLKEAIADAKAVREVALQNAKMALEEAFDSKIKNMLSAKLAEELEEDVELEEMYDEDESVDEVYDEDDKMEEEFDLEEELDEELDEEIDLDELMAELSSIEEGDDEEEMNEGDDEEDLNEDFNTETLPAIAQALGVGIPVAKMLLGVAGVALTGTLAAVATKLQSKLEKTAPEMAKKLEKIAGAAGSARRADESADYDEVDESFDIDALISEIESELEEGKKKGKDEDELEEAKKKAKKAEEELEEALSTVSSLRESISEMNLLNSKLLYCNKLFRANSLNETQKVKVIDALDKAITAGEAKLVYETLQESFTFTNVEKRSIKEGLARASKPAGVAPKKVITESVDETVSRFQKLANIKF